MTEKEPEQYKPVNYEQFGDYYEISNYGNVRNISTQKAIKLWSNNGYMTVRFTKPKIFQATVSRMVAFTFIGVPSIIENTVNHIDENKQNNYYKNLEWITQKENIQKSSKDTSHKKRIVQMDLDGNVLNIFNTINEAAKTVGVDRTTVSKVIVGVNQTAGGFKWAYEDVNIRPENREIVDTSQENIKCLTCMGEHLGIYYVYNDGRIYNKSRNIFLKPCVNDKGANYVTLPTENAGKKNMYIHRIVAMAFIPNPFNKKNVKHIDNDKNNNSVENLLWY
jgi:hypothetical protein